LVLTLVAGGCLAQSGSRMPSAIQRGGVSLGLESPDAPVSATVWLNLHGKAQLDEAVKQMYTVGSPTYHQWMSRGDLKQFEPTAEELAAVKSELVSHHLTVVAVDPANFSIKFTGQTSAFESAFHTQVMRYQVHGRLLREAAAEPQMTGAAAGLVSAVTGFENDGMRAFHEVPRSPKTGQQIGLRPLKNTGAGLSPDGAVYSNQCLDGLTTIDLAGPGTTTATYSGVGYGANPNNTVDGTIAPCGYSPEDVWKLYGLANVYAAGYQGQGQTIVLIDAYGSPTLTADLTTYSSIYGLPAPTATNLKVYKPTPFTAKNSGWALETTLDVEWAHAMAPAADLAAVAVPNSSDDDLQAGVMYAVNNHLGNVISNSYGSPESEESTATLNTWNTIIELAASQGISVQFATGDEGDYAAAIGYTDVSAPADSPYATAVGGTTMAFSPLDQTTTLETGWGNNVTELSPGDNTVDDPPVLYGFQGGSGGGISSYFAKPGYQAALLGSGRHLPDVSALADPFTGVEVIFTMDNAQYIEVVGGTSLATPVFSAFWALVDQYYGKAQGQAAPSIPSFPLTVDVIAPYSGTNVSGSITDSSGRTNYSSIALSEPLDGTTIFAGALYNAGGGSFYNLTFGTDSSLTLTNGWDDVTGYGTLNFGIFP
jgi:subtilase family serine protease